MSKMGDLYSDIQRAEALMDQEQNIKARIYEAFSVTVQELLRRNKELEDSVRELLDGIESHGAEKWMPHRVDRAKNLLGKL